MAQKPVVVPLALILCLFAGCGGGRKGNEISKVSHKSLREIKLENFQRQKAKYQDMVRNFPDRLNVHLNNARQLLRGAQELGLSSETEYFQKEIKKFDKLFRDKALKIFRDAERKAQLKNPEFTPPDEAWYSREEIWNECVGKLQALSRTYANGKIIKDLIREATDRREGAALLYKAFRKLVEARDQAKADVERDLPEEAVARLAITRAALRALDLIGPDGEVEEREDRSAEFIKSARSLVSQLEKLIKEYEKKLPAASESGFVEAAVPLLERPWEEIPAEDFLAYLRWSSDAGSCESAEGVVTASAGPGGGIIESFSEQWGEFVLEFEVKILKGERFWVGARPVLPLGEDRPLYKNKVAVKFGDGQWHKVRVQLVGNKFEVYEVGQGTPKVLAEPKQLPPVGGSTKPGFMIGLEPGVKLSLRALRVKLKGATVKEGEAQSHGGEKGSGKRGRD